MKKNLIIALLINVLVITAFTLNKDIPFLLGTDTCIVKYKANSKGIATLLSLHDNENTAIDAFNSLPEEISFNLFEIHQVDNRFLTCGVNGRTYKFDPNRIFSDKGIKETVIDTNEKKASIPPEVITLVKTFSNDLLKAFTTRNPNKYVVSIHNNLNGYKNKNGTASILHYIKNKNAKDVHISKGSLADDTDDYFVVTLQKDFDLLKSLNKNVAMEMDHPEDDGSLSVYCRKNNIPYINIEAENGHKPQQTAMLEIIYKLLKRR